MKQFRKRFLAAILSFVMVFLSMSDIFSAYAGPPAVVDDPDVVANVTYDQVAVASRGNSDFYVGEEVSFYANITMQSGGRSLPGAYSKLYLPKKIFGNYISTSNISTWINRPATNYLNVDYSSDNEYIIVTMKYTSLGSGTTQTVPFKATIQPNSLANNETYTIPWQVYDGNGTLVESSNNTFTAKTYPIGYTNEINNYTKYYSFLQGSSDLQNNTTLSNNFSAQIDFYSYRTDWPTAGTFHGTSRKYYGSDRRKTRVTIKIPANASLDTSNSNNAGWQYDAVNSTVWKDILYPSDGASSNYTYVKFNNQPVGTNSSPVKVTFPITWQYVNDDGSLDPASLEKSTAFIQFTSYPGTPPTDNGLYVSKYGSGTKLLGERNTTEHTYSISAYWSWSSGNPTQYPARGTYHHTISSIEDTPRTNEELELMSYKITYPNSNGYVQGTSGGTSYEYIPTLDATQQAALSHNKLIGTKMDGSTEIIATNVAITSSSTEVTLPNPTQYKKIELKFDNPIEVQSTGGYIVNIQYKFRLAQSSYNSVKTQLAPMANTGTVWTYNDVKLTGDTNTTTPSTRTASGYVGWSKPYAYEDAHNYQNQNLGTQYIDNEVELNDYVQFYYNLPAGGRDIKNPKFIALADPGFEFKGITATGYPYTSYTQEFTQAVMDNYRVEYNYKNTGKTAYIWDNLPDLNLPEGNRSRRYIYFTPKFKFTRNVTAGPGTIDSYMYWDNNEEAPAGTEIPGLYPDTLDLDNDGNTTEKFSSKKASYIYSPPLELILTKKSKRADAGNAQYSSITTPDSEQTVDYQLNIFNNSIAAVTGFTFYDILPHVGDKSIVPNQQGVYTDRGSTYKVTLAGPITANSNYTYEYSTTPVTEGNIAANYAGATWVSSVSDWSQVTMFRAKMKPGYSLASHTTDILTFKAKMPDTVPLDTTDKAVNTFAGFSGNNYGGAFEALNNTVVPKKYKISGKIYYDVPPAGGTANGTYLTTDDDAPAAGRSVALYKSDGTPVLDASGNPVTTTADANGDYSFDNISTQGTYKVVVTPGTGDTLSGIHVTSTSLIVGNDFNNGTLGGNAVFEANVTVTPSADKKTANAALEASNSTLKVKYVDMSGNPIPLDSGAGNVPDTDSTHAFRAAYSVTPPTTLTGVANFEYAEPDLTNGRPLAGTLNPGQNVVILKYKRKQAGDITVHHYEVGQTTELYTPTGAAAPSAEVFDGTAKLGLTENLTNKAAAIANFEYVSVDRSGAGSATTPSATGDTTVTYQTAPQTVTYYYKRKNAANITVHHYEDGTTTELYSQTAGGTPSAVTISGAGKLGLTEDLTNKVADILNYEYVSVDVSGAPSATSPSSTGETTLTHRTTAQTVIYKYKRKDAGNVIVHHYEQGTTNQLVPDMTLPGTGKLGLPYTTTTQTIPNFTVVTVPSNQNGTYQSGNQTVTYYYKRNNAGNITVHHYEVGQTTELYKPTGVAAPSAEVFDGTGKLGLSETFVNREADIDNYEYVSVDTSGAPGLTATGGSGQTNVIYQTGVQTVIYRYRRKNAANITVHHYEDGTTTELFTPTGAAAPSAVTISGTGKLGLPENLTNQAANIANFEYVSVDVSGAPSATSPSSTGATTLTHGTAAQTVIYKYKRKDAGNVIVKYVEQGTNTPLKAQVTLSGAGKLGLPYTTTPDNFTNYDLVSATPTGHTGNYPPAGSDITVTYEYKRKNAGNITVNHYEVGTTTQLYKPSGASHPSAQVFPGAGKLGLSENLTNKAADIANYEFVNVDVTGASGASTTNAAGDTTVTYVTGNQVVNYYYRRKNAANITIHHYEDGTTNELFTPTGAAGPSAVVIDGTGKLGLNENLTNQAANIANFEYVSVDVSGAASATTPSATGATTLTHGTVAQTVIYKYRRKNAGNITVNHYEVGGSTQLYTPTGAAGPSAESFNGAGKLGLTENLTNKEADIANYEFVNVETSGAPGASTPSANGAIAVTYRTGNQTVTYRYRRKSAANITVHHYEDGTTTELFTPTGAAAPSAVTISGTGKLGLPENLTNQAANIANFEYVSVDVSGAPSATSPSSTGATTLTHGTAAQTVIYKYKRKDAGNVIVKYVEQGTNTPLKAQVTLSGAGKLGLPYTTTPDTFTNYDLVSATPTGHTGNYPPAGNDITVTYEYRRKNAGNITVNHYEVGGSTQLYTPTGAAGPSAESFNGTGKLGLSENLTNKAANINNYEFVSVDVSGASGASTPNAAGDTTVTYVAGPQTVTYRYRRKDAANITVHHYEDGTTNELYTPAGAAGPSEVTVAGAGKLGLTESFTNQVANIANFEYVSVDVSGAPSATTPSATGTTMLTHGTAAQTLIYKYRRKNAGNVIVHHYENGTTTQVAADQNLSGVGKMGLTYTTAPASVANYTVVNATPTDHTGTYPNTGTTVVTYYYTRDNAGNVTVHHYEQGTTTQLAADVTLNGAGQLGLPYTTGEQTIPHFTLVAQPTNKNGVFTTGAQTVTYFYRRNDAGNVLVHHYENGTTTSVSPDENLSGVGKSGLTYTTSPASVANYTVVSATPADHTGTYPSTGTTVVTYYYTRDNAGDVTVHHYEDGTTNPLMADLTLNGTGMLGLPYTTTEHTIPNFTLVAQPANKNGVYTTGNQTVTYFYRRNDAGNILVHHYEAGTTTSVSPDENLSGVGKSGLTYTTSPAAVANYTVVNATPTDHSGNYPASGTTVVTYYYTRNDAGDVTVKYLEQGSGTSLHSDTVLSGAGKLGLPYTTNEENITDYELVAQPANKNGTFTAGSQTVIYEYRRKPAGDVTTVYVDDGGNVISTPDVQSGVGKLGLPYNTTAKTIPNFTLVSTPLNANGVFTSGPQTVTYVYRRSDAGNVTVYHKSVYDNSDLSAPTVLDGTRKLGLPYTTSPESYADFEVSSVPANANGTFASGAQTVTYLYKRKQSGGVRINYLDNHGNRIETTDTISGSDNVGLPYTTSPKTIPYYDLITVPSNANGTFTVAPITVDYIYKRKDAGTVTVEHIDENGNVPIETPEVLDGSEKLGLAYTTSAKNFDNFDLIGVPSNASGIFESGNQTVTYVYRRKDAGNVIAYYVDWTRQRIAGDEILDGSRSLGLPYSTSAKSIAGYHLQSVRGNENGVFTTGITEVMYIYEKDPSAIIVPAPLTPQVNTQIPINPSPINPITPISPQLPLTPSPISPVTPISPQTPITPSSISPKIATPSQIIVPGDRNQDLIIRPKDSIVTPSIATASNGSRGGSVGGSTGGNSVVRPTKTVTTNNGQAKNAIDTVVPVIDKPTVEDKLPTPQKATLIPDTRKALSVPKTADSRDIRGYFFILISSLTAAISLVLKKKENK